MTRKRTSSASNLSRRRKQKSSQSYKLCVDLIAICIIGCFVYLIYKLAQSPDYTFSRTDLDKYIEVTHRENLLGDGASIYVDMSDGMNSAYAEPLGRNILQAVINKMAANDVIRFFELAEGNIDPINMSHTQLYNYMMNSVNYKKQRAPIEKTLERIILNNQPALLMTDFEEYNGGLIQKAAYAKKYFIDWLAKGYNITFYKWDFTEKEKSKHMFLAVFDDNANRLNSLIQNAAVGAAPQIRTFVLGSRDFAYPTASQYLSLKQGGNYHNSKGLDIVTNVLEDGGVEAYISYAKPLATAEGAPGKFAPLNKLIGSFSEYYPIGVSWTNALTNSRQMAEAGIAEADAYKHLLSHLYIDFDAQSGFSVDEVEVRVFNMQKTMEQIASVLKDSISTEMTKSLGEIRNPEVNEFLIASMNKVSTDMGEWSEINIDFAPQFNGNFPGNMKSSDLLRANIVISKASPRLEGIDDFFGWEGNPSLANSIRETLTAKQCNPEGRILFSYYLKTISE